MPPHELEHLSYSSISLYQTCPRAWSFRYQDRVQVPSSPSLVLGSAVHNTVEAIIRARYKGEHCEPQTIWAEAWRKATQQDIAWGADLPEEIANSGLRMVCHKDTIGTINSLDPLIEGGEPVIEKRIELRVPGVPLPILGFIDLITADHVPHDFKTSAKSWTQDQADRETQPLFYLAALNQLGSTMNVSYRFRHVVFVKTKTPQVQVIESRRSAGALFWLAEMIQSVWRGIEREVFPPNPGAWLCSAKWCSYWRMCRGRY